jgi:RNA polymerase sigma-70 factor, ECF subfamily
VLISLAVSHTLTSELRLPEAGEGQFNFEQIYREHIDYVWRALVHLGVARADVADVAHDVFLVVRRRLPSFEGRSSLRTWIYGICIRTVSDYRNRAFRRRELSQDEPPEQSQAPSQERSADRARLSAQLARLLDQLSEDQRTVLVLYEIEELPMKDVAEAVGCPLQTAYSRLHAARNTLKAALTELGYTP